MLKNYIKIALRNLWRAPGYTAVNVIGLAVGVACCLTITLFVLDELSYDRFHEKADRIYRVVNERHAEGEFSHVALTPPAYAQLFQREFPEVEESVRFFDMFRPLVQRGDRKFFEPKLYLADSTVFKVFSLPLKRGNPETALTAPNTLVIAESIAKKYFGEEDPLGQTLTINDSEWTVTGVMEEIPRQSHLELKMLGSFQTLYTFQEEARLSNFQWQQFFTFVLLREGADSRTIEARLPALLDRTADPFTTAFGVTFEAHLQPLTDIHLRSGHLTFDWGERGNIAYVWAFSGIALFVLLIACFNFMNLSTARATSRAREVGMRKVIGARRAQLVVQFLGESTLMAFGALIFAILLTEIILPLFNPFVGKELGIEYTSGAVLPALVTLGLVLGIVAGSYPALYLSAFRPAKVLKGELRGSGLTTLRRTLVVTQFVITIALMIGTAVIYRQLQFTRNADLGFQRDLIVKIPLVEDTAANVEGIKNELLKHSSIASVTASWGSPGGFLAGDGVHLPGRDAQWGLRVLTADYDFISTYGMRMVAGRDFSPQHPSDEHDAFIINEAAAEAQGWTPEEAVGKELIWDMWGREGQKRGRIVGVVENFHYGPLRDTVEPVMINIHPVQTFGTLSIRIRPRAVASALAAIEAEYDKWVESWPFEYTFLEDELAEQYLSEEKLARVCAVFAGLAVLIACLGLFGLTGFVVRKRTKEIGIRKVMGASVERIVLLLARDFTLLVAIAFLIAVPIAYLAANEWLEDFAYRIQMEPLVFIVAGVVSLGIAVATVSYHTVRAATADPVASLRYE